MALEKEQNTDINCIYQKNGYKADEIALDINYRKIKTVFINLLKIKLKGNH